MKTIDYQAEYAALKTKFPSLPEYDTYNHYVEISFLTYDIYDSKLMARFFRRLLERRIESMISFFQSILYPNNQSLVAMEESGFFSESEKQLLSDVMKKCMILYRTCSTLNFVFNEKEECAKITEIMEFLITNQPFIDNKLEKIKNEWGKQGKKTQEYYMG